MGRTALFRRVMRAIRVARFASANGMSSQEALDFASAQEASRAQHRESRRRFLQDAGRLALGAGLAAVANPFQALAAPGSKGGAAPNIGIVGAGLSGLVCADQLKSGGILAKVYDANAGRAGGRCFSDANGFPGQVFERGGELIDNLHKTMLGLAQRFKLTTELQWRAHGGEETFYFGGRHVSEAEIVDEYRVFVDAMRNDLQGLSSEVTADSFTAADLVMDQTSLADYFDGQNSLGIALGPLARNALEQAYLAEYGLEIDQQSALNFLFFAKADKRSSFLPFGVFSDERYHIVEGNDAIVKGLYDALDPGQVEFGMKLIRMRKTTGGIELTFAQGNKTVTRTHDAVVVAIPFTTLREVQIDASLELPAWKRIAINELGYGTNAKTMIGFQGRPWGDYGSVGVAYTDLGDVQNTWETNPSRSTAQQAILTDYASGIRGAGLRTQAAQVNSQVDAFLNGLDKVWPGSKARALKDSNGRYRAILEHWPSNPLAKGSYTCYTPGQFTRIAGNEGKPVGNLFFAGEHANSFYDWQGFLEGACNAGVAAASDILARVKAGAL